jgi:septation ring formation regulator EzrA
VNSCTGSQSNRYEKASPHILNQLKKLKELNARIAKENIAISEVEENSKKLEKTKEELEEKKEKLQEKLQFIKQNQFTQVRNIKKFKDTLVQDFLPSGSSSIIDFDIYL